MSRDPRSARVGSVWSDVKSIVMGDKAEKADEATFVRSPRR